MKKLNQTDISDASEVDKTSISRYLRGETEPRLSAILKILNSTGLPLGVLHSMKVQKAYLVKVYLKKDLFLAEKGEKK